jgi:hypothetical protein
MTERNPEVKLQLPTSLFNSLSRKAKEQGVSLEALCLSLLKGDESNGLIEPAFYNSLSLLQVRDEVGKVLTSDLPQRDKKTRINTLELMMSLRYVK